MTQYRGINYGMGWSNIDHETGIRYGVISSGKIGEAWYEDSEPEYGSPHCPHCGNDDISEYNDDLHGDWEYEGADYACADCKRVFGSESAFPDEVQGFTYIDAGYRCFQSGDDSDIFVEQSPYYTYAQFCSPCAPGAGHLECPFIGTQYRAKRAGFPRVYCFGHDWFESGKAPYRVYRVSDRIEVKA